MADEKKKLNTEEADKKEAPVVEKKAKNKSSVKKPNFFVRVWKKLCKLCKDTVGELKKVVWTSKEELGKSTKLVLVTVLAVGIAIAVTDTLCSWIINSIAGLIG